MPAFVYLFRLYLSPHFLIFRLFSPSPHLQIPNGQGGYLPKYHPQAVNKYFFACEVQHKSNHPEWPAAAAVHHGKRENKTSRHSLSRAAGGSTRQSLSRTAILNSNTSQNTQSSLNSPH